MKNDVNPRRQRPYNSSRRQQQADENRRAVLEAARLRFLQQGYAATTLAAIAADAGVSVETIYKTFSNKAGLLKALFDVAVAGDDAAESMAERDVIRRISEEPDATKKLRRYAAHLAEAMGRAAPVQLLARDAAAADPAAAAVWEQTREETLKAMTMFAHNLAATGALRVTPREARDVLWTLHGPEVYEMLVICRGWSPKRYGRFLADSWVAALVRPLG
jgi:AcrR family transcriptional regulator